MLDSVLVYHCAFHHLELSDSNYKSCLLLEEWTKVEKVWKFLKVFSDTTLLLSGSQYSTANLYFPNVFQYYLNLKTNMEGEDVYLKQIATKI